MRKNLYISLTERPPVMLRNLVLGLTLTASTALAGPVALCNQTSAEDNDQSFYQPFTSLRGQLIASGTAAVSVTLPAVPAGATKLRIDFQNRNDFLFCLDPGASDNWCGTNPPTGTISNTAWVFKQASVKVSGVRNTSNTANVMPTTLYVSPTSGVTGYSICGAR